MHANSGSGKAPARMRAGANRVIYPLFDHIEVP
jgi:hypothetical protein